jgi:hydrogenase maturation protease
LSAVLVLAWGNPSRGDDALGPELAARLESAGAAAEVLTDFQLQPEHATDLHGRSLVLFVDASVSCPAPFAFARVAAARDASFSSHAMSPAALLAAYEAVFGRASPPAYALAIRGERFDLGEPIGDGARRNLDAATALAVRLLGEPDPAEWDRLAGSAIPS